LFDGGKEKKPLLDFMRGLIKKRNDVERIPVLLIKGLVNISENPDDPFNQIAIELLRDTCNSFVSHVRSILEP
jgi:hypothetical protein